MFKTYLAIVLFLATFAFGDKFKTNIDDLIAVVQVFRHGERAPCSFVANDPYASTEYWPNGYGQLSNVGKRQHYNLGTFTRQRYGKFIPKRYNSSYFKAQTTDVDRTHMSCQSNLAAIFPPANDQIWNPDLPWQPIPIHPIDANILIGSPLCTNYEYETAKVVLYDEFFAKINKENEELYQYLTKATGSTINTVSTAWSVWDTLYIEELNGLELPNWADQVYPEPLRTLTSYAFLSLAYTDDQKKLITGSWLNTITEYFTEIFQDPTNSAKYQIYSAHDSNIATILSTLGAFNPHPPAFASSLWFELRNKSGIPTLNIWHKNNENFEPITVRNCQFDCSLEDFKTVLSPWIVNITEWNTLCSSTNYNFNSTWDEDSELLHQVYKQHVAQTHRKRGKGNNVNYILN